MSAKVNGTAWSANKIYCYKQTSSPIETVIVGQDTTSGKSIAVLLFDYNNTTGTFKADASQGRCEWSGNFSDTGTIIITAASNASNGVISGQFNFTTYDSAQVTEGKFTATLP
jgi:hypothetical protein